MAVLIPEIGHAALLVALGLAVYGALAAVRAAATARPVWLQSARNAAAAHFLLVTAAALALEYLLVTSDFSVRYVADADGSGVIMQYNCRKFSCPGDLVANLTRIAEAHPRFVYLAPNPTMDARIAVTRLGEILVLDDYDPDRIRQLITK